MSTLLFYDNPIALSSRTHLNLKVKASDQGFNFSGKSNSVVLAGIEFSEACRSFPIVFGRNADQQILPMALLGFRNLENLFVDANGKWKSDYVPAYIRRYPFVLAKGDASQKMAVCIDESYPGFGADEGQPLFTKGGEPTAYLKVVLAFLREYQAQLERTELFVRKLRELGLLMDISANVTLPTGERLSLANLMVVDKQKLQSLPDAQILQLFRSDELAWIYSHLLSIGNLNRMPSRALPTDSAFPENTVPAHTVAPTGVAPALGKAAPATGKSRDPSPKPPKK